jgi:hypothetical protein
VGRQFDNVSLRLEACCFCACLVLPWISDRVVDAPEGTITLLVSRKVLFVIFGTLCSCRTYKAVPMGLLLAVRPVCKSVDMNVVKKLPSFGPVTYMVC